ncbi:MAG: hypothetical protein LBT54_05855 [Bifidobacteriaceae bacterium]|nr:hypothetical protein [Bifidobacteriaceae bacterium]
MAGRTSSAAAGFASLAAQTLAADRFEIVVLAPDNGAGGTAESARATWGEAALPDITVIRAAGAGAGFDLRPGIAAARGDFTMILDGRDRLSRGYLETMARKASPSTMVVGIVAQQRSPGVGAFPEFSNPISRASLRLAGGCVSVGQLPEAVADSVGQLVPTAVLRAFGHDGGIDPESDPTFWVRAILEHGLAIQTSDGGEDVVYYRGDRAVPGSPEAERRAREIELDAIGQLEGLAEAYPEAEGPIRWLAAERAARLGTQVARHPTEREAVLAEIGARQFQCFPHARFNEGAARDLVIAYAFPPFLDASGLTAAKRLLAAGRPFDLVTHNLAPARSEDSRLAELMRPLAGARTVVKSRPRSHDPASTEEFCRVGIAAIDARVVDRGPYAAQYSRSMWPDAHVLGALAKARYPDQEWTAEFSDPLLIDSRGLVRSAPRWRSPMAEEIEAVITARGLPVIGDKGFYGWLEGVVYALADRIVFTNPRQREFQLSWVSEPQLTDRALKRSATVPHPVPGPELYHLSRSSYQLDPARVNLGYFGVFYETRGVGDILGAFTRLGKGERARLRLHIFTDRPRPTRRAVCEAGLGDCVNVAGLMPYLDFLELTTRLDWLIVADARVSQTHGINPYLPSKLSDYRGSGTPIWGLVEPGSMLSEEDLDERAELGHVGAAAAAVRRIIRA